MRLFHCGRCGGDLDFDPAACSTCGTAVGYRRDLRTMVTAHDDGSFDGWRRCSRSVWECNWLVPEDAEDPRCFSCSLTRRRPDSGDTIALEQLAKAGVAKRRLIFQLDELGLPIVGHLDRPDGGLAFDLVSSGSGEHVVTGHASGVITIDVDETDDARRERTRVRLGEQYRTMLGHFRHEIGHYYWQQLVWDAEPPDGFRALFGDERASYRDAIGRHYREGAPAGWEERYISSYATMHPWEDFAESFAHYLHICDALQTAEWSGLWHDAHDSVSPEGRLQVRDIGTIVSEWVVLAAALNRINRSIGKADLYPFILPPPVVEKLGFVHRLVSAARVGTAAR